MKIYDKAKAERDVPQMMKAYLTAMQYRTLVTPDSLETDMKELENWAKQTEKAEGFLFGLGFRDFRVRMVDNTAKLELRETDLPLLLENREKIVTELRKDYDSVLLNLEVRK